MKNLSNCCRTLELPSINCKINLDLNWSEKYFIVTTNLAAQARTLSINDKKLYVPVLSLSTQDNTKLIEQLKSGFKRAINWSNYE